MMRAVLVLALVSGCAIGGSSSMVGRWRARRMVDSTACVENQTPGGGCAKLITIGRDVPARRFQSTLVTVGAPGYLMARGAATTQGMTMNSHLEYMRGRGGFALGARLGGNVGFGLGDRVLFTTPVSVLAHVGGLWGSVYAGVGYAPIAHERPFGDETMPTPDGTYHHNAVHGFLGTRFWFSRTFERGFTFNPELRIERFGDETLLGITANFGLLL